MKYYKAYGKGLKCRDKQYEENTAYKENGNVICKEGMMHFCERPMDVMHYYDLVDINGDLRDYTTVTPLGEIVKGPSGIRASTGLHINDKLSQEEFAAACIEDAISTTTTAIKPGYTLGDITYTGVVEEDTAGFDKNWARIVATDDYDNLGLSGEFSRVATVGYNSHIVTSGEDTNIATTGDNARIYAVGNDTHIANAGEGSCIVMSGRDSVTMNAGFSCRINASGDNSIAASAGNFTTIKMTGKNSIGAALGNNGKISGKIGDWIILTEHIFNTKTNAYECICIKAVQIDGDNYKEDTMYSLKNGDVIESKYY